MASTTPTDPIKALSLHPRGGPLGTSTLRALGVSSALASHYVKAGWLKRLGRGVFMFPKDTLQREQSLLLLESQIPGLHVGGKAALAWRGIRHNIGPQERLSLWGPRGARLPPWFTDRFPSSYVTRQLFDVKLPSSYAIGVLPESPDGPSVSEPERALLELLSDVGVGQGVEEARNIMESLRSARLDVLGALLKHCVRVKVVRLCVQWAEELGLGWAAQAREAAGTRGRGRWTARLRDGTTLILKP